MAKLPRIFQALFGLNGDQSHFEQFGAKTQTGNPIFTKDPASLQAGSAFTGNGWVDAINGANKAPFLEDMNGLFYLAFRQIAYLMQAGIPEWDASTEYAVGSIVTAPGTSQQYGSLVNGNINNPLPNQTSNGFWGFLNPQTIPAGVMSDYGGTIAPAGYVLCDGSVYTQATFPALFAAIGSNWNIGGEGAGNFRVPDLRGRTSIGAGQGSGLTNRTVAQLVGEETHQLVVGEIPSHSHAATSVVSDTGHNHLQTVGNAAGAGLPHCVQGGGFNNTQDASNNTEPNTVSGITVATTIGNTGGAGAHNIMQPSAVVTKIIKV